MSSTLEEASAMSSRHAIVPLALAVVAVVVGMALLVDGDDAGPSGAAADEAVPTPVAERGAAPVPPAAEPEPLRIGVTADPVAADPEFPSRVGGMVVDVEGVGIGGARVALREVGVLDGDDELERAVTTSLADGCFQFARELSERAPAGRRLVVHVQARGFRPALVAAPGMDTQVMLERFPLSVLGRVVSDPDGASIPDAQFEVHVLDVAHLERLDARLPWTAAPVRSGVTDGEGRFSADGLDAATFHWIVLRRPGWFPSGELVSVFGGQVEDDRLVRSVTVEWRVGWTLLGEVFQAESGDPAGGASVSLMGSPFATSDPQGRFEVERCPPVTSFESDRYGFFVDWLDRCSTVVGGARETTPAPIRVPVLAGGTIDGFVFRADGTPADRAVVRLVDARLHDLREVVALPELERGPRELRYSLQCRDVATHADTDGSFALHGVVPRDDLYTVVATEGEPPDVRSSTVVAAVQRNEDRTILRISLPAPENGSLTGRVEFATPTDEIVTVSLAGPHGTRETRASDAGDFQFEDVAPGDYELILLVGDLRRLRPVSVKAGKQVRVVVRLHEE